jgi:hypothetical protein
VGGGEVVPSTEDVAWAAGLFEGEGSFYIWRKKSQARASMTSTDRDVLERFIEIVGIGTIIIPATIEGRKDRFMWTIAGYDRVKAVIDLFEPWLGERRRIQAAEVLENCARRKTVAV